MVFLLTVDLCDNATCLFGGVCNVVAYTSSHYVCICPQGYAGIHCEIPVSRQYTFEFSMIIFSSPTYQQYKLLHTIFKEYWIGSQFHRQMKIPHCAIKFETGEENRIVYQTLYWSLKIYFTRNLPALNWLWNVGTFLVLRLWLLIDLIDF